MDSDIEKIAREETATPEYVRIKPLEWVQFLDDGSLQAHTPFGSYTISVPDNKIGEREFRWKYCFDEYYDEEDFTCDGIEDGKAKAQAHWSERISSLFEPVDLTAAREEGRLEGAKEMRQRRLRFLRPQGDTFKEMQDHARNSALYPIGDATLVWVNEGDFWMSGPEDMGAQALTLKEDQP